MIDIAIPAYLTSHSGLSPLVGDRIEPTRLPEHVTLPAITFQRVSGVRGTTYDGPAGYTGSRYQFDVWGNTFGQVRTVADALCNALLGVNGEMSGVRVQIPMQEIDIPSYEPDTGLHRITQDYRIWHE